MFDKSKYKVKRLFKDEGFENGFNVLRVMNGAGAYDNPVGKFQYPESKGEPSWMIAPWYSNRCLIKDRKDVGDPYILTDDEDTKLIKYNPKEKSLVMQINAQNIYKGGTTVPKFWPHLLIEQRNIVDYINAPKEERVFYSAESDRIVAEFDMRVLEYIKSPVKEGDQRCQFVAYAYMQLLGSKSHIYFGYRPLVAGGGTQEHFWNKAGGESNMIYALSTETVFGSMENSFLLEDGHAKVSEEWKHIEVDLTPHIDRIIETANRDLTFGRKVSRDEFYFSGTNVGFEVRNNISCTVEIKNYNLVSYVKKEN